jgi:transcriptional regulator with XRE-family HTH domain
MFAQQLKAERKRLGLTQADAAKLLDVSPRAIWKWEHGNEPLAVTAEGVLARLKKAKAKK